MRACTETAPEGFLQLGSHVYAPSKAEVCRPKIYVCDVCKLLHEVQRLDWLLDPYEYIHDLSN
jgi:hypothetical protein